MNKDKKIEEMKKIIFFEFINYIIGSFLIVSLTLTSILFAIILDTWFTTIFGSILVVISALEIKRTIRLYKVLQ